MADQMPSRSKCPFCRIADGDPDGQVLARAFGCMIFAPLNPVTRGHALVVPEVHVEDFAQNPAVSGAAMMAAATWVGDGDFNVITSKGFSATQSVPHLHIHVVPRVPGDGLRLPWTPNEKAAAHPWELQ